MIASTCGRKRRRSAYAVTLAGIGLLTAPAALTAQTSAPAATPICPPPMDVEAFTPLVERMLIPGKRFSLEGISPELMGKLAIMQKTGVERQAHDWAGLCRYAPQNEMVAKGSVRPDVVFLGDSITEFWQRADPTLFNAKVVDRGISGQTSAQILLRFYADVVALKPRVVHILAGTNDVGEAMGPVSDDTILNNISAMIDMARANGIKVVVAALPPSRVIHRQTDIHPAARIIAFNTRLRALAIQRKVQFVDYHTPLADAEGGMPTSYTNDDLHPNRSGYAIMRPLAERAIAQALK